MFASRRPRGPRLPNPSPVLPPNTLSRAARRSGQSPSALRVSAYNGKSSRAALNNVTFTNNVPSGVSPSPLPRLSRRFPGPRKAGLKDSDSGANA